MIEAYPLYWPEGRPRTSQWSREASRFETGFARARDAVLRELELLIGRHSFKAAGVIISTNIALRRDGLPLANQRQPDDVGVAVYFTYRKRQMCLACDRWKKIEDNMWAIAKTIDALRGIARWGTGDMMEAAFRGFAALPAPGASEHWRDVLGFGANEPVTLATVKEMYRRHAHLAHPDKGGTHEKMSRVNRAWTEAQKELA